MADEREWTNAELVEGAAERGFSISERLLVDWTEVGLLDRPRRRPTGRGSDPAVRPESQARLLWVLLDKHRVTKKHAVLVNIPVFSWLGWGESYVPLRQVRRAMRTYCAGHAVEPGKKAKVSAADHIRYLQLDRVPRRSREQLEAVIIAMSATPQSTVEPFADRLSNALRGIVAPNGTTIDLPFIENLLWLVDTRTRAAVCFREGTDEDAFPDSTLRRVQQLYFQMVSGWAALTKPSPQELLQERGNRACLDLLTQLGLDANLSPLKPSSRR